MTRRLLSAFLLASGSLGCATISRGEPLVHDQVIRVDHKQAPSSASVGTIEQSESMLHVRAEVQCDLVEEKKIHRTSWYKLENGAFSGEMVLLAMGAVPTGIGIGLLADSSNVYEDDQRARLYNPTGQTGAIAGGVLLLVLGAALMTVPIVDSVRSIGTEKEEIDVAERGSTLRSGVPCEDPTPAAGRPVVGLAKGSSFSIGTTDSLGKLNADLADITPPGLLKGPGAAADMRVLVGPTILGTVALGPVAEVWEARQRQAEETAWRALDLDACRSKPSTSSCAPVAVFLMKFPGSIHAEEIRTLLDPEVGGPVDAANAQVAASPEDIAKAEAVKKAVAVAAPQAKKAGVEACKKKCEAVCKKEALCSSGCAGEACQ